MTRTTPARPLTLADDDTDAADLTLAAHSDDQAVIPDSGIHITGTGLERTVTFTPTGKGRANITFTVTDDADNHGIAQLGYAASSAPASASGRYLYESSDLSSAVDVGDGHILAASSEDNKIRLYAAGRVRSTGQDLRLRGQHHRHRRHQRRHRVDGPRRRHPLRPRLPRQQQQR